MEKNTNRVNESNENGLKKYCAEALIPLVIILKYKDLKTLAPQTILNGFEKIQEFVDPFKMKQKQLDVITTSQLRNIHSLLRKKSTVQELLLCRPRLAYIAARENKHSPIACILDSLITKTTQKNYKNFDYLLESIVAYHRFYNSEK